MRAIGVGAALLALPALAACGAGEKTVVDTRVKVRFLSGDGAKAYVRPQSVVKDRDGDDWLVGWKTGIRERVNSSDLVAKAGQGEIHDCRIRIVKKSVSVERTYKDAELTECRKTADAVPLEKQVRLRLTIGRVAPPTFQGRWQFPQGDPEVQRLLLEFFPVEIPLDTLPAEVRSQAREGVGFDCLAKVREEYGPLPEPRVSIPLSGCRRLG